MRHFFKKVFLSALWKSIILQNIDIICYYIKTVFNQNSVKHYADSFLNFYKKSEYYLLISIWQIKRII